MLGGAGPAIAAVPLTAIWVGGSVVTVATSLATMQLGPLAATQRVGYVALASLSQARPLVSPKGQGFLCWPPSLRCAKQVSPRGQGLSRRSPLCRARYLKIREWRTERALHAGLG